jgi:hypothetical protein
VELESHCHLAEENIVGTLTVWEGPERSPVGIDSVDLLVRPRGFTRTLDTVHLERVAGRTEFLYESARFPIHDGQFEIIADLPGSANIPGTFFRR